MRVLVDTITGSFSTMLVPFGCLRQFDRVFSAKIVGVAAHHLLFCPDSHWQRLLTQGEFPALVNLDWSIETVRLVEVAVGYHDWFHIENHCWLVALFELS